MSNLVLKNVRIIDPSRNLDETGTIIVKDGVIVASGKDAQNQGVPAYMVDNASELDPAWIAGKSRVGVTAGASAPEILVQQVIDKLKQLGADEVRQVTGIAEKIVFPLPKALAL